MSQSSLLEESKDEADKPDESHRKHRSLTFFKADDDKGSSHNLFVNALRKFRETNTIKGLDFSYIPTSIDQRSFQLIAMAYYLKTRNLRATVQHKLSVISGIVQNPKSTGIKIHEQLETRHKNKYLIYNLTDSAFPTCSPFNPAVFNTLCVPLHGIPRFSQIMQFVDEASAFNKKDEENVVVCTSRDGKGTVGVFIACYLIYTKVCASANTAIDLFTSYRMKQLKRKAQLKDGSTMEYSTVYEDALSESQCRWIAAFADMWTVQKGIKSRGGAQHEDRIRNMRALINDTLPYKGRLLKKIIMTTLPDFDTGGGCNPYVVIKKWDIRKNGHLNRLGAVRAACMRHKTPSFFRHDDPLPIGIYVHDTFTKEKQELDSARQSVFLPCGKAMTTVPAELYPEFDHFIQTQAGYDSFFRFLKSEYSEENLIFWRKTDQFPNTQRLSIENAREIIDLYVREGSAFQVNVSANQRDECTQAFEKIEESKDLSALSTLFHKVNVEAKKLMRSDSFPRYCNSSHYMELYEIRHPDKPLRPICSTDSTRTLVTFDINMWIQGETLIELWDYDKPPIPDDYMCHAWIHPVMVNEHNVIKLRRHKVDGVRKMNANFHPAFKLEFVFDEYTEEQENSDQVEMETAQWLFKNYQEGNERGKKGIAKEFCLLAATELLGNIGSAHLKNLRKDVEHLYSGIPKGGTIGQERFFKFLKDIGVDITTVIRARQKRKKNSVERGMVNDFVRMARSLMKHMDVDNSGGMEINEINRFLSLVNQNAELEFNEDMFDLYDRNKTGKWELTEFVHFLRTADLGIDPLKIKIEDCYTPVEISRWDSYDETKFFFGREREREHSADNREERRCTELLAGGILPLTISDISEEPRKVSLCNMVNYDLGEET